MKLYRLLAIVMYLMNRKKVTAKELADYFEVSVRTIYRDLEAINQAGVPIISYQGSNGGYSIIDNYKIDKQILNCDEMNSILVALEGLNTTLNKREFKDIKEKIKVLIPDFEKERMEKNKKYFIDFNPWGINNIEKNKIDLIEKAIDKNILLNFSYTDLKGVSTTRIVEAMTLVLRGNSWYLYGYCRLRADYRFFKIYRIKELKILKEKFKRKDREFEESFLTENIQSKRKTINLVMRFKPEVKLQIEEYFNEDDIIFEEDGTLLVKVSFTEDEWLYSFILSFGDKIEILEPFYLRKIIKEQGKRVFDVYK
ncbi:helix-turn-helix transcriptional regulator [Halanaerobium praevalens]|uniref:Regulatory protein DeoR n=1 Tax=Halanaerobium praevalens (strain ATCC 33744 / DSM 2228 / GSL) TaxID=572479 RepID=E3DN89_HALPG|nr:YafY family protein [Halanaerobium praevalens]ADO77508.1 regulatory protein DeoR [Halanaerobium praevalens DSM 2228]